MSDEEEVMSGEEEEEESKSSDEDEEEDEPKSPARKMAPPEDEGPSEAELAMQRRREQLGNIAGVDEQTMELLELARQEREREEEEIRILRERRRRRGQNISSADLDESAQELLAANREERARMEEEIRELRQRSEQRKQERMEEEKRMAERRAEEESRRKAEEEERRRKKDEEDQKRKAMREQKMAEFEKWKNPPKPNFVISKRGPGEALEGGEGGETGDRKSREQLEAEKRAILAQRIQPLDISGFDSGKLSEKAKELNALIYRLESEKYDLEKRFKEQQYDMMELAERARQMNQVGRGGLKRIQLAQDESDPIQEKFAGAPAKIEMYSKYERQKDKRKYGERHEVFHGPTWIMPAERIKAMRSIVWDENTGLPSYIEHEGAEEAQVEAEEEE